MRIRTAPYDAGTIVRLTCPTGPGARLEVTAPDGSWFSLVAPEGYYDLWLPEVGTYSYSWAGTDGIGLIEVTAPSRAPERRSAVLASALPPLTVAARPRR